MCFYSTAYPFLFFFPFWIRNNFLLKRHQWDAHVQMRARIKLFTGLEFMGWDCPLGIDWLLGGLTNDARCVLCNSGVESRNQVFFEGCYGAELWKYLRGKISS